MIWGLTGYAIRKGGSSREWWNEKSQLSRNALSMVFPLLRSIPKIPRVQGAGDTTSVKNVGGGEQGDHWEKQRLGIAYFVGESLKRKTISIFVESVTRKTPNSLKIHLKGIWFTVSPQERVQRTEKRVFKASTEGYPERWMVCGEGSGS